MMAGGEDHGIEASPEGRCEMMAGGEDHDIDASPEGRCEMMAGSEDHGNKASPEGRCEMLANRRTTASMQAQSFTSLFGYTPIFSLSVSSFNSI